MYNCKQNQGAEIYFCLLFLFFLFSFSHSYVITMDFLSNISQKLLDIEFLALTSDMTSCTVYKKSATNCLTFPLFVHFSFFPIKVVLPLMATAGGM